MLKRKFGGPDGPDEPGGEAGEAGNFVQKPSDRAEEGTNYIEIEGKSCSHVAVWPRGVNGPKDVPRKPEKAAMEYPFKLDPFQQTSINCLEAGRYLLQLSNTCSYTSHMSAVTVWSLILKVRFINVCVSALVSL